LNDLESIYQVGSIEDDDKMTMITQERAKTKKLPYKKWLNEVIWMEDEEIEDSESE
jgi:hypothetical protein